jgi:hypothetical protein
MAARGVRADAVLSHTYAAELIGLMPNVIFAAVVGVDL